jgi:hypothetical protein
VVVVRGVAVLPTVAACGGVRLALAAQGRRVRAVSRCVRRVAGLLGVRFRALASRRVLFVAKCPLRLRARSKASDLR